MKKILLLTFITLVNAGASNFEDYLQVISKRCPSAKPLALKKSLIELSSLAACSGPFTQIILNNCSELDCEQLISIYDTHFRKEQGRVIGR